MERTLIIETIKQIGKKVKVCGWVHARRDHGKIIFIDLRDRSGLLQIVFPNELAKSAGELRSEWVIAIEGTINKRPEKLINPKLATGEIELKAEKLEVLTKAETPPFVLDTDG
jgi:aspartyl-tRNA synthetase